MRHTIKTHRIQRISFQLVPRFGKDQEKKCVKVEAEVLDKSMETKKDNRRVKWPGIASGVKWSI